MTDETNNVIAFTPRPPAPPPPLRLELKLHDQSCSVDFCLLDAEDRIVAVIPFRPGSAEPDKLDLLRMQWARLREENAEAS